MLLRQLRTVRFALGLSLSLAAAALHAQTTINVGPGQPYTTIQAGINAANNGDTVLVAPGTYTENIDFKGKAITVTSSGGPANTIIDGGQTTATVSFKSGELRNSVISNFTIRNAGDLSLGGVYTGMQAEGGVFVMYSSPSILNNTITSNLCSNVHVYAGAPLIQGNEISNVLMLPAGTAYCSAGGTGVELYRSNTGTSSTPPAVVVGNTIENNIDSDAGNSVGGLLIGGAEGSIITGNIIRNNSGTVAGGIYAANTYSFSLLQNLIENNTVIPVSGSVTGFEGYDRSGGIYIQVTSPYTNVGPTQMMIAGNTITGNSNQQPYTAASGFGIASQLLIENDRSEMALVNNIIIGSDPTATAIICLNPTVTPLVMDHNDIYAAPGSVAIGGVCNTPDPNFGNLSADPLFTSSSNFQLMAGSPAIDMGNNSGVLTANDIVGNTRIQDATGRGYPVVDMGAYESAGAQNAPMTAVSLLPSTYTPAAGGALILTATVNSNTGIPVGTVQFVEDSTVLGTANTNSSGVATFTTFMPAGLHTFKAVFNPSPQSNFPPASSVYFYLNSSGSTNIATIATLAVNPGNPIAGEDVTLTATIKPSTAQGYTATGTVTFTNNGVTIGTEPLSSNGTAAYVLPAIAAGKYQLSCTYSGDSHFASSACGTTTITVKALPTTATLTVSPNPANTGQTVTATATIAPVAPATVTPTGNVSFYYAGTTLLGTVTLSSGSASFVTTILPAGNDKITCTYSGDSVYATSKCNTVTETIINTATTIKLTSNRNPTAYTYQNVTFTVKTTSKGKVPLTPITLTSNGTLLTTLLPTTETTKYKTAFDTPGTYTIVASFAGNATQSPASATLAQVVILRPSTSTLVVTPAKALIGQPVTLTATVDGLTATTHPGGKLTFYDGTTSLGTFTLAKGVATLTTSTLAAGPHSLTCTFAGNKRYAISNCNVVPFLIYEPATIVLSATPGVVFVGNPVALSTSVSSTYGTPTGSITFVDGTTPLGTVPLASTATGTSSAGLTTTTLALGTHTITASYTGDNNFAPAISPPVTVIVEDLGFTLSPNPLTIHHGGTAVFNLSLNALGGPVLASPITFTISGNPDHAPVTFSPSPVPATAASAAATLTIATPDYPVGPWSSLHKPALFRPRNTSLALLALGGLLLPFTRRSRRKLHRLSVVMLFVALSILLGTTSGCGSGWGNQSYHLTVTATSGNLSRTATATLITQP